MNWVIIDSCADLAPLWRQAIIWSNDDLVLTTHLYLKFSESWIKHKIVNLLKWFCKSRLQNVGHFDKELRKTSVESEVLSTVNSFK